jgi:hypothetical protein
MTKTIDGFSTYFQRGFRSSVIHPSEMIPDEANDLIGFLAAKLRKQHGWSFKKEKMRQHLERLATTHGYQAKRLDYRDYQLTKVGQSFQYDVPVGKRGFLSQFAGRRVRLVCTYSGTFRQWVRVGVVK